MSLFDAPWPDEFPGLVAAYVDRLERRLREAYEIQAAFDAHEWFYGVPCGPTLSMIDPTKLGYVGPSLADVTALRASLYGEQPRWIEWDEKASTVSIEIRP